MLHGFKAVTPIPESLGTRRHRPAAASHQGPHTKFSLWKDRLATDRPSIRESQVWIFSKDTKGFCLDSYPMPSLLSGDSPGPPRLPHLPLRIESTGHLHIPYEKLIGDLLCANSGTAAEPAHSRADRMTLLATENVIHCCHGCSLPCAGLHHSGLHGDEHNLLT